MNWYDQVRKYVWNDITTPYFISVSKLTRLQAQKELFVYTLFLAILFGILAVASIAGIRLEGGDHFSGGGLIGPPREQQSPEVALYAFSVFCGALLLGITKHPLPALYCGTAPVAGFLYVLSGGFRPDMAGRDKILLIVFTLLWAWYALRVHAIAKAYPEMPLEFPPESPPELPRDDQGN